MGKFSFQNEQPEVGVINLERIKTETMNRVIGLFVCNTKILFDTSKRFAGHNKWSNIKHIKADNDRKKGMLFHRLCRQMRIAIIDGQSSDPVKNTKLSQVIDIAKKADMPIATINNVLNESSESRAKFQTGIQEVHGPGNCIILVQLSSDQLIRVRGLLRSILKKVNLQQADMHTRNMFKRKGIITTKIMGDLESATDHAIQAGAEDVEELEMNGEKFFQFSCDHLHLTKVKKLLQDFNYELISADEEYIPQIYVELNEEQLEKLNDAYSRIYAVEGVLKVYDNVA